MVRESWNGSRRIPAQFQGIPSWACWYYQFPRKRLEGPRGLVFSPGGMVAVLEAQFYTRAVGTDVVHAEMTTAARGGWYTDAFGVTGIQVDWYTYTQIYRWTGILVFHEHFHFGINLTLFIHLVVSIYFVYNFVVIFDLLCSFKRHMILTCL